MSDFRRRSARLTPYKQSSSNRRRERESATSAHSARNNELFEKLVSKVCHVYSVSPLWKFETTPKAVDEYSQRLTGLLRAVAPPLPKGGQQRSNPYVGVVSVVKNFDANGSYAVQITVRHRYSAVSAVVAAPVCVAVLCRTIELQAVEKGFTYLPLMLVHGNSAVTQVLMDWLKSTFDCFISAPKLDQTCLHLLATQYATTQRRDGRGTRGKVRGLKLVYNLPEPVREAGLSSVTLDLPFDSIMSLSRDNTLSQMIEEMVHTHFHLKLSSLTLVGVSTPVLQIHCDAIIKFFSADHVTSILSLIQQTLLF